MNYKKIISVAAAALLMVTSVNAYAYTIDVDKVYSDYLESGSVRMAKLIKIDGTLSHGTSERVSGFMYNEKGELADIAETFSDDKGKYTLTFVLRNDLPDANYKIKVSSQNCENEKEETVKVGKLGSTANIQSFSINGKAGVISGNTITVSFDSYTDLRELVPVFTISDGAEIRIGTEIQESGTTKNNFQSAVTYTVTSEDLKTVNTYTVSAVNPTVVTGGGTGGSGGSGSSGSSGKSNWITPPVSVSENVKTEPDEIFNDLSGYDWAKPYIISLYNKGAVKGFADGSFMPGNSVTREEFVKMLVSALKITGDAELSFTDLPNSHWAYADVKAAVASNIVYGISDTLFGTGTEISRQDMAVIACRAAKNVGKLTEVNEAELSFADSDDIAEYAKDAVAQMCAAGYISGTGNNMFEPNGVTTRAAAAVLISKIAE